MTRSKPSKTSTTPAKLSTKPEAKATTAQIQTLDSVLAFLPSPNVEANEGLRLSLERYGQLTPILRRAGTIVDGRRRLATLTALKVEPWIVDIDAVSGTVSDPMGDESLGRSFLESNACRQELPMAVRVAMADVLATRRRGDNQHASSTGMSREEAAKTVGVSADSIDRLRRVKTNPVVHARVLKGEMSLQQGVRVVEAQALAEKAKSLIHPGGDIVSALAQLANEQARFNVLLADAPWDYGAGAGADTSTAKASPARHYPTMTLDAIKALRVQDVAAADAVLWFWTPNCLVPDALDVVRAWGFTYVTSAVWVKTKGVATMGSVRPYHETLLIAKRGQGLIPDGEQMPSVFQSPAGKRSHSAKPAWFAEQMEQLYPNAARTELFCRNARPGWVPLGNQCEAHGKDTPKPAALREDAAAAAPKRASRPRANAVIVKRARLGGARAGSVRAV